MDKKYVWIVYKVKDVSTIRGRGTEYLGTTKELYSVWDDSLAADKEVYRLRELANSRHSRSSSFTAIRQEVRTE